MPISCPFRDCKALLVTSLTHVSDAITSVQTFTFIRRTHRNLSSLLYGADSSYTVWRWGHQSGPMRFPWLTNRLLKPLSGFCKPQESNPVCRFQVSGFQKRNPEMQPACGIICCCQSKIYVTTLQWIECYKLYIVCIQIQILPLCWVCQPSNAREVLQLTCQS